MINPKAERAATATPSRITFHAHTPGDLLIP